MLASSKIARMDSREFQRVFTSGAVGVFFAGVGLGGFVGALWIYAWPTCLYVLLGVSVVLAWIGRRLMKRTDRYMAKLLREAEEREATTRNPLGNVIGLPTESPGGNPAE